jgi:hypothetical protein
MKIIGFAQLRNELEKGNLENWFKCMKPICDYIYIYDQNSIDGSLEYYKQFENTVVIASPTNRFREEIICKAELLNKIKAEHPDTNFIVWLDGDTLIDGRLLKDNGQVFRKLCKNLWPDPHGAYNFYHKNLWRSDVYERIDDQYDYLDRVSVVPIWKFNPNINFPSSGGLHQGQYPVGIENFKWLPYSLVHRGFATDYQIMTKYDVYKSHGQNGWCLERLLNEQTLTVKKIDYALLPEWFQIKDDVDPTTKRKIREIYNDHTRN